MSTSEIDEFAHELLQDGTAISIEQAGWMASILLDGSLSLPARLGLLQIAKVKGASFHPADITQDEITASVSRLHNTMQMAALLLCDPAGRA